MPHGDLLLRTSKAGGDALCGYERPGVCGSAGVSPAGFDPQAAENQPAGRQRY